MSGKGPTGCAREMANTARVCNNAHMALDFDSDAKSAFMRGFWSGMAAPMSLFVTRHAQSVPQVKQVVPPSRDVASAINGDWKRVGDTMQAVIGRYEQAEK